MARPRTRLAPKSGPSSRPASAAANGSAGAISLADADIVDVGGRDEGDEIDHDPGQQQLVHEIRVPAAEPPDRERDPGRRRRDPDQVQRDEEGAGAGRQAEEVGSRQQQQALGRDRQVVPEDLAQRRQLESKRPRGVAADRADDPVGDLRDAEPRQRPDRQRDLVPSGGRPPPGPRHPERAHHRQRDHRRQQHDRVREVRPGNQRRHEHRHPPARPLNAVDDEQDEQQRHRRADVVGRGEELVGAGGELRSEHDPDADRHPRGRLPAGRRPLGHQRGEQQHERVGHRRGDVHDALGQPVHQLDERVLRHFGSEKGHVRRRPAAQQHVAVEHVPGLQRLATRRPSSPPGYWPAAGRRRRRRSPQPSTRRRRAPDRRRPAVGPRRCRQPAAAAGRPCRSCRSPWHQYPQTSSPDHFTTIAGMRADG